MGNVFQHFQQVLRYIIYINEKIYDVICSNFDCSLMYVGVIEGVGLCYCLLIEDKVMCFVDRNQYQIFFELEGLIFNEIYLNGIFISLLFDVQM